MKKLFLGTFVISILLVASVSTAGVIKGVVHIPAEPSAAPASSNAYPGHANSLAGVQGATHGLVTDGVVYVEKVPASAESVLSRQRRPIPQFAQKNQSFVPRVLVVAAGTRVDFPNLDPIYHNVFSLSNSKRFDLGKYPRGKSKQLTLDKCGLVNVYCDIHSNMEGFILVLPNHYFTRPESEGAFALPDLPQGRYSLKLWHPDLGVVTKSVEVPEQGAVAVDLSF